MIADVPVDIAMLSRKKPLPELKEGVSAFFISDGCF